MLFEQIIEKLQSLWPNCKIVHGKPRHSQPQGSVKRSNQDVERKITCWMNDHKSTKWSQGLRYVQYSKNRYVCSFSTSAECIIFTRCICPSSIINFGHHLIFRCYHSGIGMSPFQALFGDRPVNTINALALPEDLLGKLKTEEDLKLLTGKEIENGYV